MKPRSPTLEGFRAYSRRPSFGLAEIAWRWSFGAAASLLLVFSFFKFLDTLPVGKADLLLLRSRQLPLIFRAVAHIFRGSAFRVVERRRCAGVDFGSSVDRPRLVGAGSHGKGPARPFSRARCLHAGIQREKGWRLRSLFALNFFRLGATLAAAVGCLAAILLSAAASRPPDPAPGSAVLIFLTVTMLVWFAWSTVNWLLSLAAIFVLADAEDTFGAITAAIDLCRARPGIRLRRRDMVWSGTHHGIRSRHLDCRLPLGFRPISSHKCGARRRALVTLLYFAVADFLYVGRLAAYVAMVEMPDAQVSAAPASPPVPLAGTRLDPNLQSSPAVDASELILSDVPASS